MNHNPNAKTNIPLSPEESYLASRLFGKSLFSAIQLSREMEQRNRMEGLDDMGAHSNDVLRIPIPVGKLSKTSNDLGEPSPGIIGRALQFNRNPIRTIVGGESGFQEGRHEYYHQMRSQIQKELAEAQRDYLSTLERIKTGSETPLVDSFCNGIAAEATIGDMLPKVAGNTAETVDISDGSIRRLLGKALGVAKKPLEPAINLGATGLVGTAAGSSYLTYLLKKKLREKEQGGFMDNELPTRIELEPWK
jgi:hypothetical protein